MVYFIVSTFQGDSQPLPANFGSIFCNVSNQRRELSFQISFSHIAQSFTSLQSPAVCAFSRVSKVFFLSTSRMLMLLAWQSLPKAVTLSTEDAVATWCIHQRASIYFGDFIRIQQFCATRPCITVNKSILFYFYPAWQWVMSSLPHLFWNWRIPWLRSQFRHRILNNGEC